MSGHTRSNRSHGRPEAAAPSRRRGPEARVDAQLKHRLVTRSADDLAPMLDLDRRAAGHEEPARNTGPGYGHGV